MLRTSLRSTVAICAVWLTACAHDPVVPIDRPTHGCMTDKEIELIVTLSLAAAASREEIRELDRAFAAMIETTAYCRTAIEVL